MAKTPVPDDDRDNETPAEEQDRLERERLERVRLHKATPADVREGERLERVRLGKATPADVKEGERLERERRGGKATTGGRDKDAKEALGADSMVRATQLGFYANTRRRRGTVFQLEDAAHFSASWMEAATGEAPVEARSPAQEPRPADWPVRTGDVAVI